MPVPLPSTSAVCPPRRSSAAHRFHFNHVWLVSLPATAAAAARRASVPLQACLAHSTSATSRRTMAIDVLQRRSAVACTVCRVPQCLPLPQCKPWRTLASGRWDLPFESPGLSLTAVARSLPPCLPRLPFASSTSSTAAVACSLPPTSYRSSTAALRLGETQEKRTPQGRWRLTFCRACSLLPWRTRLASHTACHVYRSP